MGKKKSEGIGLSVSSVLSYVRCPKIFEFLNFCKKIPRKTDYYRLRGSEVSKFIRNLYRKHSGCRKFFYYSLASAQRDWFRLWSIAVKENFTKLLFIDEKIKEEQGKIGWHCVENYWIQNLDKPNPLRIKNVEYHFPIRYEGLPYSNLSGRLEHIVPADISLIKTMRPEIIENGELTKGYSPNLIVKYSTSISNPVFKEKECTSSFLPDWLMVQAAMNSILFQHQFGTYPVGYLLYRLRYESDNKLLIEGDLNEYRDLLDLVLQRMAKSITDQSFQKNITPSCEYCDYVFQCRPDIFKQLSLPF